MNIEKIGIRFNPRELSAEQRKQLLWDMVSLNGTVVGMAWDEPGIGNHFYQEEIDTLREESEWRKTNFVEHAAYMLEEKDGITLFLNTSHLNGFQKT